MIKYKFKGNFEEEIKIEAFGEYLEFYSDTYPQRPDLHKRGIVKLFFRNKEEIDKEPTISQVKAVNYYLENQDQLAILFDEELWKNWSQIVVNYDLDYDERFPKIKDQSELKKVYGIHSMVISEKSKNGIPYCGFYGYSKFDQEHGIGFVLYGLEVLEFGSSDKVHFSKWL